MRGLSDNLMDKMMALIVLGMAVGVIAFFAVLAVGGFFIFWLIKRSIKRVTSLEYARERWFHAPPSPRWMEAYDYWLYQLENITGMTFTQSPGQLLVGCLIISVGAFLVLGVGVTVLSSTTGLQVIGLTGGIGAGIGLLTGAKMSSPLEDWFGGGGDSLTQIDTPDDGGFTLGE